MIASDSGFFFVSVSDTDTDIKLDNLEVVTLNTLTNCAIREANATLVLATLTRLFVEAF